MARMISTAEAARLAGVSHQTMARYCLAGRIKGAQLIGKCWAIPENFKVDATPVDGAKRPLAINDTARGRRRVA